MLVYAIEDEYLAQAEYDVIIEEYGAEIPEKEWESLVAIPASIEAAYEIGIEAEEKNIAMVTVAERVLREGNQIILLEEMDKEIEVRHKKVVFYSK